MAGFGLPSALGTTGLKGDPLFFDGSVTTVPGSQVTIFSVIVGAGVKINLAQVLASVQFSGVLRVFNNSSQIGTARARPGDMNPRFSWFPARPVVEGDEVEVTFEQRTGSPAVVIDAHLMATEET